MHSFRWLALIPFEAAHREQLRLWKEVHEARSTGCVLGLEHEAVITLGRQAVAAREVQTPSSSIPVIQTDRGGQATLHSQGQLVIYPILPVRDFGGLRNYLHLLLKTTQTVLRNYGAESREICGQPGLYTEQGKIAFAGLRVDRGISRHGLSININNDLGLFSTIRSCGVSQAPLDRLANYRKDISPELFFQAWAEQFRILTDD